MAQVDPIQFVRELSAKLATRSRHVCIFIGAGVARACGLPDVARLQTAVLEKLEPKYRASFERQLNGRNIEEALSRIRRIAALLAGEQQLDDLTRPGAVALDRAVCHEIVDALDIGGADLLPVLNFAAWVARANYHLPVELFTVNYDLLVETALERLRVPYFDGFVGALRAKFHIDLVEATTATENWVPAFFVRLWKLHGSVNWAWEEDQTIVRLGQPVREEGAAAIYPSDTKYEESRRIPFVVLQDRFRRALHQAETLVLVSGYSFADQHLNELIFDAAAHRERSEIIVFCHETIPGPLAERATSTPNLQAITGKEAIIGGIRRGWKAPEEDVIGLWANDAFAFQDFKYLAAYLARAASSDAGPTEAAANSPISLKE
jgi:hypothetical protein